MLHLTLRARHDAHARDDLFFPLRFDIGLCCNSGSASGDSSGDNVSAAVKKPALYAINGVRSNSS
jgi:hypothetical protein